MGGVHKCLFYWKGLCDIWKWSETLKLSSSTTVPWEAPLMTRSRSLATSDIVVIIWSSVTLEYPMRVHVANWNQVFFSSALLEN